MSKGGAQPSLLLLGSDAPRVQLRDSLLSYLHVSTVGSPDHALFRFQTPTWGKEGESEITGTACSPQLLVGDTDALLSDIHTFASLCRTLSLFCHGGAPIPTSSSSSSYGWLRSLTAPASSFHSDAAHQSAMTLLRLQCSTATDGDFDALPDHTRRELALQLARQLPCFDRHLTAYYLAPYLAPHAPEYELHVAHSILRLSPPSSTLTHIATELFPRWREQGLFHVLTLAAVHMPAPDLDWGLADGPHADGLATLLKTLPLARSYDAAARSITAFIHTQQAHTPDARHVACVVDALATLMRVKSNAPYATPGQHCLDAALASFPPPDRCTIDADHIPLLWSTIKPTIERALPPSLLLLPPPPERGSSNVSITPVW
jgi:hypothetical protein